MPRPTKPKRVSPATERKIRLLEDMKAEPVAASTDVYVYKVVLKYKPVNGDSCFCSLNIDLGKHTLIYRIGEPTEAKEPFKSRGYHPLCFAELKTAKQYVEEWTYPSSVILKCVAETPLITVLPYALMTNALVELMTGKPLSKGYIIGWPDDTIMVERLRPVEVIK